MELYDFELYETLLLRPDSYLIWNKLTALPFFLLITILPKSRIRNKHVKISDYVNIIRQIGSSGISIINLDKIEPVANNTGRSSNAG